jgi:hypothetical protein
MPAARCLVLLALVTTVQASATGSWEGKPLSEALLELGSRGLRIVFTSRVVTTEMRVAAEPVATEPREILDELLAPHGLTVREGKRGTLVVVPRSDTTSPAAALATAVNERLLEFQETVVVTPSRVSMLRDDPGSTVAFSREEIEALPHLGDDFFRAVSLVPGVASNDVAARFHVRGGRRDETQILLDGQELFDPYHLKDFDGAVSFVSASALSRAELTTGGFPVQFGDRMAGVLDMQTVSPEGRPTGHVGISVTNLNAGGGGSFDDERRTSWLVEARRGTGDLLEELIGNEDPVYADAYAKLESQLHPRHALACQVLYSDDEFGFAETRDGDSKVTDTDYRDAYVWLTHRATIGERWLAATSLSRAILDQDRRGTELEEHVQFDVTDRRRTEVRGLRQDWVGRATTRQLLKLGLELREFDTDYDYDGTVDSDDPLAAIGSTSGTTTFHEEFEEHHYHLYAADRLRLAEAVTIELGLRHDVVSLTDEELTSPRFNGVWSPNPATAIRLGWGRFLQSQRTYELQVEDGETGFYPTERSEHRILGFERRFGGGAAPRRLTLRVELYERRIDNPRPRYENLYETMNTFPEFEPDRVRIAPDRSRARGVELFLQGRRDRSGWFANYTYSRAVDFLDGYEAPRSIDQRHAVNLDFDTRLGRHWRLNLAWRYHSGWPTTPLAVEPVVDEGGEIVYEPVLGPLNSDRLDPYHRLDARASREFRVGRGRLDLFIDVQNVYDRDNLAGYDIEIDEATGAIERTPEYWTGILPSAGVTYEF